MIFDGHMHIQNDDFCPEALALKLQSSGVNGGIIISIPPASFSSNKKAFDPADRLTNLIRWCDAIPGLNGFYWIDPMEEDALTQVDMAVSSGVKGFKIICNHFHPGTDKAIEVYTRIALNCRPILFHSGILWDGNVSSIYNRPAEFEHLLCVPRLRFSLAHVSWPWCDECIAVYGKFLNAYSIDPDNAPEMFIDLTPGTPPIYRKEVITKLYSVGYDIEHNLIFGTDCYVNDYNVSWVKQWLDRDQAIMSDLGLPPEYMDCLFASNAMRFLGYPEYDRQRNPLTQANS